MSYVMYGLMGADKQYRPGKFWIFSSKELSMLAVKHEAEVMKEFPDIKSVYIVDNRKSIHTAYKYTMRKKSFDANIEFKGLLETYGIEL